MAAETSGTRKDRLAVALKENLKRRKAQARAKADRPSAAQGLGTAPQSGSEDRPETALKNVPNRT